MEHLFDTGSERPLIVTSSITPAAAYWNQRHTLAELRERILQLCAAVGHPTDLSPSQWAQLMAMGLEYQPDLILELGRGEGNSTCAFTEVANQLGANRCEVVSICMSDSWQDKCPRGISQVVSRQWLQRLTTHQCDILEFDYDSLLADRDRVLIFWDAHGFDVAECVLGRIMPLVADVQHTVIMHDLSDARFASREQGNYQSHRLWRGNDWSGPRLRLGHIDSAVEQSIAIVDFTSRNEIELHSADQSFHEEIGSDQKKLKEIRDALGDDLFSLNGHWFWFSLNETAGPYTFPRFERAEPVPLPSLKQRIGMAWRALRYGTLA